MNEVMGAGILMVALLFAIAASLLAEGKHREKHRDDA